MKIFISHSQRDEKLALKLKSMLEKNDEINRVFIFEKIKRYGVQIDQNIIKEILHSDYVVALITKDSKESASVNQELGYAQAKSIPVIPLIEKDAKKGFLVYGTDYVTFTKLNFDKACKKVQNYLIEQGPRIKDEETFTPQEFLVQKSAHFRYWSQIINHNFIRSLLVRFNLNSKYPYVFFYSDPDKNLIELNKLKSFLKNNSKKFTNHILTSSLMDCRKFGSEYRFFVNYLDNLKRYPSSELFPAESDTLIKIKDMISSDDEHQFDFQYLAKYILEDELPNNVHTFQNILENISDKNSKDNLQQNFNFEVKDLIQFSILIITLEEEYEKIQKKYGTIGIKSTDPD